MLPTIGSLRPVGEMLKHRIDLDEYHRMVGAGVFAPDQRLELIHGEILEAPRVNPPHAECVRRLTSLLQPSLPQGAVLSVQLPVQVPDHSEPQPDLCVLGPRREGYGTAHPLPRDVMLLIEVSHSTLAFDFDIKVPLYAAAEIGEVWIVDVNARSVSVHRSPHDGRYDDVQAHRGDAILTPRSLPGVEVPLAAIFA